MNEPVDEQEFAQVFRRVLERRGCPGRARVKASRAARLALRTAPPPRMGLAQKQRRGPQRPTHGDRDIHVSFRRRTAPDPRWLCASTSGIPLRRSWDTVADAIIPRTASAYSSTKLARDGRIPSTPTARRSGWLSPRLSGGTARLSQALALRDAGHLVQLPPPGRAPRLPHAPLSFLRETARHDDDVGRDAVAADRADRLLVLRRTGACTMIVALSSNVQGRAERCRLLQVAGQRLVDMSSAARAAFSSANAFARLPPILFDDARAGATVINGGMTGALNACNCNARAARRRRRRSWRTAG